MTDDFDRNLDTQRRQLDAMDAAIASALGEQPEPADLPITPGRQSYAELTHSNDELRQANGWATVDLDAALTLEQAALLDLRAGNQVVWARRFDRHDDVARRGLTNALVAYLQAAD